MKRFLCFLLTIVLLVGIVPITAYAGDICGYSSDPHTHIWNGIPGGTKFCSWRPPAPLNPEFTDTTASVTPPDAWTSGLDPWPTWTKNLFKYEWKSTSGWKHLGNYHSVGSGSETTTISVGGAQLICNQSAPPSDNDFDKFFSDIMALNSEPSKSFHLAGGFPADCDCTTTIHYLVIEPAMTATFKAGDLHGAGTRTYTALQYFNAYYTGGWTTTNYKAVPYYNAALKHGNIGQWFLGPIGQDVIYTPKETGDNIQAVAVISCDMFITSATGNHMLIAEPDEKQSTYGISETITLKIQLPSMSTDQINTIWTMLGNPSSATFEGTINQTSGTNGNSTHSVNQSVGGLNALKSMLNGSYQITSGISPQTTNRTMPSSGTRADYNFGSTLTLKAGSKSVSFGTSADPASFVFSSLPGPTELRWTSQPNGFGEIKNNSWSADRSAEEWEVHAGVPHDEKLYVDLGTSELTADLRAWREVETKGMKSSDSHSDAAEHDITMSCATGEHTVCVRCGNKGSACSNTGTHDCDGEHPVGCDSGCDDDCDGDHGTESCGASDCTEITHYNHTMSYPFKDVAATGIKHADMQAYQIIGPGQASQQAPYFNSAINMTATTPTTWYYNGRQRTYEGWPSSPGGGYKCISQCQAWANQSRSNVQGALANIKVGIKLPEAWMKGRDGNQYNIFVPSHFKWKGQSLTGSASCGGSITVNFTGDSPNTLSLGSVHNAHGGAGQNVSGCSTTTFQPIDKSWSETSYIKYIGYNGDYTAGSGRRNGPELFYKANEPIKLIQTNGLKRTGTTTARFTSSPKAAQYPHPELGTSPPTAQATISTSSFKYGSDGSRGLNGGVNDIVIHSPVAISTFNIWQANDDLKDQRIPSANMAGREFDVYLDQYFGITTDYKWNEQNNPGLRSLANPAPNSSPGSGHLGPGYNPGRSTWSRWIETVQLRAPVELVYNGQRYHANTWITIPRQPGNYVFWIPVSEREICQGEIELRAIAKNAGDNETYKSPPGAVPHDNWMRDNSPLAAPHIVRVGRLVDIIGRIGNFAVEHIGDPNWLPALRQATPGKWVVNKVVPETNKTAINYIGPHSDMYAFLTSSLSGYGSNYWFLSRWGTIPTLQKAPIMNMPIQAGMLKYPSGYDASSLKDSSVKMGYPVYFSVQTVGNYGDENVAVNIQPRYVLRNKVTGERIEDFDIYVRSGTDYLKLYDTTNRAAGLNPKYPFRFTLQMASDLRNIGTIEKAITTRQMSSPVTWPNPSPVAPVASTPLPPAPPTGIPAPSNLFDNNKIVDIGSMDHIKLTKDVRTYIGSQVTNNQNWNAVPRGRNISISIGSNQVEAHHGRQAQRWHGMLQIPSSSKFLPKTPGGWTKNSIDGFMDTKDWVIDVHMIPYTTGSTPWNIQDTDYWVEYQNSSRNDDGSWVVPPPVVPADPAGPWGPPTNPRDDVVITFNPNEPSTLDIARHGTH